MELIYRFINAFFTSQKEKSEIKNFDTVNISFPTMLEFIDYKTVLFFQLKTN